MKKIVLTAALAVAVALPSAAQDTYEGAKLMTTDLNGTARYVGMGGALEALGAEISAIGTNPAAIGLFRHSTFQTSLSVVSQQDAVKFADVGKTHVSFDQAGFVYSTRMDRQSFINIAFNYHKSRNFNQILSAANSLRRGSLNQVGFAKYDKDNVNRGGYNLDWNVDGDLMGFENNSPDAYRANTFTQVDYLYMNAFNAWPKNGSDTDIEIGYLDGDSYAYNSGQHGWISDFDINLSGNVNDRVYLGLTVGVYDVNYKSTTDYAENLVFADGSRAGNTLLSDEHKVTGTGIDIKAGVIFRPLEYSPFRVGLSVSTPTWYDLKTSNSTVFYNNCYHNGIGLWERGENGETYEFKMYTPWKFDVSLGHTIGTQLALGATYEYADYSSMDMRVNDGYDYNGNRDSHSDRAMNTQTDHTLKGVHMLKVGAELKPDPALAVRAGYNYVSPMYEENGVRDMTINSIGVMYSSTNDYVNWKDTHRVTCGLGYKYNGWNFDLAYQYSMTKGTFNPYQPNTSFTFDGATVTNLPQTTEVNNKRHQVLATVGYTF